MLLKFKASNKRQIEVLDLWENEKIETIIYGGAKACGKSYLGAFIFLSMAWRYPGTHYFIARKRLTDITKAFIPTWNELISNYQVQDICHVNQQKNWIEFNNGSKVLFFECRYLPQDPLYARFGSHQMTQGWIEEGGEIDAEAKANLQATIGRWKNNEYNIPPKLLITCNPSPNFLFDIYKQYQEKKLPPHTAFVTALPTDNPYIPERYIKNLQVNLSPSMAKRLLFGQWEFDTTNNLFKYEKILTACDRTRDNHLGSRYLAIDVAIGGDDYSCILLVNSDTQYFTFTILAYTQGLDAHSLFNQIKHYQNVYAINSYRTAFDADGVGGYLRSFLPAGQPYRTGSKANRENFKNLRAECLFYLATLFDEERVFIHCNHSERQQLIREFSVVEELQGSTGAEKLDCTSKTEIKSLIGNSPDILDAFTIATSFFVGKYHSSGKMHIDF